MQTHICRYFWRPCVCVFGADKDTDLISIACPALPCLTCRMKHLVISYPRFSCRYVYFSAFSAAFSWHVFAYHLHADEISTFVFIDHCFWFLSAHWCVFSTLSTTPELPCVFVQLFLSCRHRRTDVSNFTAGSLPVDPYGFTGMAQHY